VVLLIVTIGGYKLTATAIWYDEWWSIYYAGASRLYGPVSLVTTIQRVTSSSWEANPTGYFLALNLWTRLTGDSVLAVRAWSLLMAPLALAFTYRAAADLNGRKTGLAAILLLGTSAFFIRYTYEARGYMQVMMFAAAALWSYWRLVSPRWKRRPIWLGAVFSLSILGLLYTHYLAIPVIGATALYHLLFVRKDRQWWRVTALAVVGALPFIPWLAVAIKAYQYVAADPSRSAFARSAPELLQRLLDRFSSGNAALVLILAFYALFRRRLPWFIFVVAFLALGLLNTLSPFIDDVHYLLALLPSLAIILAIGAVNAPGRGLLVGLWIVANLAVVVNPAPRDLTSNKLFLPWPEVKTQLQTGALPHDRLVFALPQPDPNWLHQRVADYYLHDLKLDIRLLESLPNTSADAYTKSLDKMTDSAQRLWIAYAPDIPPSSYALATLHTLNDDFFACEPAYHSPTLSLQMYAKANGDVLGYTFGQGIALDLIGDLPSTIHGPESFFVRSSTAPDVPPYTYSIALHVLDAQGQLRAQMDYGLPTDTPHCHRADIPALPAGNYILVAGIYDWHTGARLPGAESDGDTHADTLTLGQFTVIAAP
jgi:hypothetical protein